jgi:hypothetical protein
VLEILPVDSPPNGSEDLHRDGYKKEEMIFVEKLLKIIPLFCGVCLFVSGAATIWHLPSYKRKVDAGRLSKNSKFSFRTL